MATCQRCTTFRKCGLGDLSLQHTRPDLFVSAQFGARWTIITWYTVWAAYFLVSLLLDVLYITQSLSASWLLVVSNWSITLVTCSATVNCVVIIYVHAHRPDTANGCRDRLPWYMRLQWVLTTTSSTSALLVAVFYWALGTRSISYSSTNKHIIVVVYVLVKSSLISSKPVRLLHFVHPMILGVCYIIVSLVYQLTTAEGAIYYLLDWRVPQRSAPFSICVIVLAIPLAHFVLYSMYKLRIFIFQKYFDESHSTSSTLSLQRTLRRRITATDVILQEEPVPVEIEVPTECKDDMEVQGNSTKNNQLFPPINSRHYCSENDLRDYTMKNGLYCEFARSSHIFHHGRCGIFGSETAEIRDGDAYRGSQMIVVQAYADKEDPHYHANSFSSDASDCVSNTTSDDTAVYF